jgi:4-amino-4-deoxy-L-arabinose transferase-like glycosyltransferase
VTEVTDPRASRRAMFVAVLFCAAAFGSRLSTIGLLNPDEGRYVEIAREMIATGDYLEPTIDGRNHWTKPPGTYWAIAACLRAFDFAPWSARIPAALAGWTTVLALFVFLRRRCGPVAAAVGAAALASTLHAFALFRMATPDALQTACIAVALAAVSGGVPATVGRAFVATAALSASFLVKGPIGLFVFAAAHVGDWLCGGARRIPVERLRRGAGAAVLGMLLVFAVGLQWYAFEALRRPELLRYWFFNEVAGRYFSDVHGRSQPWWYFVPVTLGALAPWTSSSSPRSSACARGCAPTGRRRRPGPRRPSTNPPRVRSAPSASCSVGSSARSSSSRSAARSSSRTCCR